MEEEAIQPITRRSRWRRWRVPLAILLFLFLVAFAIAWLNRVSLATSYIDDEFARRGVQARYEIRRIGFGSQVLENLVIGDPRRPDATVRRVEVVIRFGLTGPQVGLITARGVRMFGRVRDGRLSLGQVDRLLPPPSGLPFRLPDQAIDVSDAALVLETPSGRVALGLAGRGNLADGFRGHLAMVSHGLRFGECGLAEPRASVDVNVADLRPRFRGPAAMQSLRCGQVLAVQRPLVALDALLAPALDSWRGTAAVRSGAFSAGASSAAAAQGRLSFDGAMNHTRGSLMLEAASARVEALDARRLRLAGHYQISLARGELGLEGDVATSTLTMREPSLARITSSLRAAQGTPFGPIGAALAEAMIRAGRGGMDGRAGFRLRAGNSRGAVQIGDLNLESRSGARLAASGGAAIVYEWPAGAVSFDRDFALSGGGFPDARFQLAQGPERGHAGPWTDRADGGWRGQARTGRDRFRRRVGRANQLPHQYPYRRPGRCRPGRRPGAADRGLVRCGWARHRRRLRRRLVPRPSGRGTAARPNPPAALSGWPRHRLAGARRPAPGGRRPREPRLAGRLGQSPIHLAAAECASTSTDFPARALPFGSVTPARSIDLTLRTSPAASSRAASPDPIPVYPVRSPISTCWSARARALAGRGGKATIDGGLRMRPARPGSFHPLVATTSG